MFAGRPIVAIDDERRSCSVDAGVRDAILPVSIERGHVHDARPRIVSLQCNKGMPGSVVLTSVYGSGLERIIDIRLSGSGVDARILCPPSPRSIDAALSIAADATAGPRAIWLVSRSDSIFTDVLFYVLAPSGYASASGIGSHLL